MLLLVRMFDWLVSAAALVFAAQRAASSITRSRFERLCAAPVFMAAMVVCVAEILSMFDALKAALYWQIASILCAGFSLLIEKRAAKPERNADFSFSMRWRFPTVWLACVYAGLFLIALCLPANTWDSMSYHLARIGYYLQQGNLAHFPTPNARQTNAPLNAELVMLWTVVFLKRDFLCALVQFGAALGAALALFGIARRLRIPRVLAGICVLIFLGLPEIVLQATSTQNDLFTAWLCSAAIYFLLASAQSGSLRLLIPAAVAGGLACGAKPTAWLVVPGAAVLWLVASAHSRTLSVKSATAIVAAGALGFSAFVLPQMVRNRAATDHFVPLHNGVRLEHPSFQTVAANAARMAGDSMEANDLPFPVNRGFAAMKRSVAATMPKLLDAINPPGAAYPGARDEFAVNILSEDVAWFGLNGFLMAGAGLCAALAMLARRNWMWVGFAAAPIGYCILHATFLTWQPWGGRLFCPAMALFVPLGVRGLALLTRRFSRPARRLVWRGVIALALCGATVGLLQNELKPLHPRPTQSTIWLSSIWELSRDQQRCRLRPYNEAVLAFLSSRPACRVGFCADEDQWDYLAFLPDFRNHVIRYDQRIPWPEVFSRDACDVVIAQRAYCTFPADARVTWLNDVWAAVEPETAANTDTAGH